MDQSQNEPPRSLSEIQRLPQREPRIRRISSSVEVGVVTSITDRLFPNFSSTETKSNSGDITPADQLPVKRDRSLNKNDFNNQQQLEANASSENPVETNSDVDPNDNLAQTKQEERMSSALDEEPANNRDQKLSPEQYPQELPVSENSPVEARTTTSNSDGEQQEANLSSAGVPAKKTDSTKRPSAIEEAGANAPPNDGREEAPIDSDLPDGSATAGPIAGSFDKAYDPRNEETSRLESEKPKSRKNSQQRGPGLSDARPVSPSADPQRQPPAQPDFESAQDLSRDASGKNPPAPTNVSLSDDPSKSGDRSISPDSDLNSKPSVPLPLSMTAESRDDGLPSTGSASDGSQPNRSKPEVAESDGRSDDEIKEAVGNTSIPEDNGQAGPMTNSEELAGDRQNNEIDKPDSKQSEDRPGRSDDEVKEAVGSTSLPEDDGNVAGDRQNNEIDKPDSKEPEDRPNWFQRGLGLFGSSSPLSSEDPTAPKQPLAPTPSSDIPTAQKQSPASASSPGDPAAQKQSPVQPDVESTDIDENSSVSTNSEMAKDPAKSDDRPSSPALDSNLDPSAVRPQSMPTEHDVANRQEKKSPSSDPIKAETPQDRSAPEATGSDAPSESKNTESVNPSALPEATKPAVTAAGPDVAKNSPPNDEAVKPESKGSKSPPNWSQRGLGQSDPSQASSSNDPSAQIQNQAQPDSPAERSSRNDNDNKTTAPANPNLQGDPSTSEDRSQPAPREYPSPAGQETTSQSAASDLTKNQARQQSPKAEKAKFHAPLNSTRDSPNESASSDGAAAANPTSSSDEVADDRRSDTADRPESKDPKSRQNWFQRGLGFSGSRPASASNNPADTNSDLPKGVPKSDAPKISPDLGSDSMQSAPRPQPVPAQNAAANSLQSSDPDRAETPQRRSIPGPAELDNPSDDIRKKTAGDYTSPDDTAPAGPLSGSDERDGDGQINQDTKLDSKEPRNRPNWFQRNRGRPGSRPASSPDDPAATRQSPTQSGPAQDIPTNDSGKAPSVASNSDLPKDYSESDASKNSPDLMPSAPRPQATRAHNNSNPDTAETQQPDSAPGPAGSDTTSDDKRREVDSPTALPNVTAPSRPIADSGNVAGDRLADEIGKSEPEEPTNRQNWFQRGFGRPGSRPASSPDDPAGQRQSPIQPDIVPDRESDSDKNSSAPTNLDLPKGSKPETRSVSPDFDVNTAPSPPRPQSKTAGNDETGTPENSFPSAASDPVKAEAPQSRFTPEATGFDAPSDDNRKEVPKNTTRAEPIAGSDDVASARQNNEAAKSESKEPTNRQNWFQRGFGRPGSRPATSSNDPATQRQTPSQPESARNTSSNDNSEMSSAPTSPDLPQDSKSEARSFSPDLGSNSMATAASPPPKTARYDGAEAHENSLPPVPDSAKIPQHQSIPEPAGFDAPPIDKRQETVDADALPTDTAIDGSIAASDDVSGDRQDNKVDNSESQEPTSRPNWFQRGPNVSGSNPASSSQNEAAQRQSNETRNDAQANQPEMRADQPEMQANQPEMRADQPEMRADQPETQADQPRTRRQRQRRARRNRPGYNPNAW